MVLQMLGLGFLASFADAGCELAGVFRGGLDSTHGLRNSIHLPTRKATTLGT